MPCKRVGGDGLQQGDRLLLGQRRRGVLLDAGGLDGGDVLGDLPGDQPLGRELLVGAAQHRQAPGDGGRRHAGLEQGALVELDVVGGDLQRGDALGLHVADEIHEVAAVGFDRVVRQQRVADPRHQRRRRRVGVAAAGLQGAGEEGFDLVGGRGVAVEEVAALGDEGRARRGVAGRAGSCGGSSRVTVHRHRMLSRQICLPRYLSCESGLSGLSVARRSVTGEVAPCHCSGKITLESESGSSGSLNMGFAGKEVWNIKRIMFHSTGPGQKAQEVSV